MCHQDLAFQRTAVGTEVHALHYSLQGHQLTNIYGALIWQVVIGRVEVHNRHFAAEEAHVLLHSIAVCRLSAARRAYDQLPKGHAFCS